MRELINIPVPFQTFNDLSDFLDGRRTTEEYADVAGRAISEWIAMQNSATAELAGCTRNAWKHVWLLLPGETRWQLAEKMRT